MGQPVGASELYGHLDRYGRRATVVTVSDGQRPHVGTSLVEVDGDHVVFHVGPRAAGFLAAHPDLTLTWTPPPGDDYQLIVDATAAEVTADGDRFQVVATVHAGIRHRVADAAGDGASCVALGSA